MEESTPETDYTRIPQPAVPDEEKYGDELNHFVDFPLSEENTTVSLRPDDQVCPENPVDDVPVSPTVSHSPSTAHVQLGSTPPIMDPLSSSLRPTLADARARLLFSNRSAPPPHVSLAVDHPHKRKCESPLENTLHDSKHGRVQARSKSIANAVYTQSPISHTPHQAHRRTPVPSSGRDDNPQRQPAVQHLNPQLIFPLHSHLPWSQAPAPRAQPSPLRYEVDTCAPDDSSLASGVKKEGKPERKRIRWDIPTILRYFKFMVKGAIEVDVELGQKGTATYHLLTAASKAIAQSMVDSSRPASSERSGEIGKLCTKMKIVHCKHRPGDARSEVNELIIGLVRVFTEANCNKNHRRKADLKTLLTRVEDVRDHDTYLSFTRANRCCRSSHPSPTPLLCDQ
eukprot:gnl/Dysnectes_brevis/4844_a6712_728.p1 GENE.gnl/Dysnectes_brevis/4844_a6712_728~~gnl/Dysnectes_brevis/4844_a6712_728.p1  ORF type:complete len:398 (+),score=50.10 gnl/Dysnectes_brevis/4844_a6712_728:81-1274(+)